MLKLKVLQHSRHHAYLDGRVQHQRHQALDQVLGRAGAPLRVLR